VIFTAPSELLAGDYIIKADVTVNSGTCEVNYTYAGVIVQDDRVLATGSYEFNVTASGSFSNVVMYFNGTNEFDVNFTNVSIVDA